MFIIEHRSLAETYLYIAGFLKSGPRLSLKEEIRIKIIIDLIQILRSLLV